MNLQPTLLGKLLTLRPLLDSDFEALYEAALDPLIWELHPERTRYQRDVFKRFFDAGMKSMGALLALDSQTNEVIGTSRYAGYNPTQSQVEIGYTFLKRSCWGKGHNTEMKKLMIDHAFESVNQVLFYIGENNYRSRKAVEKLGATFLQHTTRTPLEGSTYTSVVYGLLKPKD